MEAAFIPATEVVLGPQAKFVFPAINVDARLVDAVTEILKSKQEPRPQLTANQTSANFTQVAIGERRVVAMIVRKPAK